MKIVKRILLVITLLFVAGNIGAYFYFRKQFTAPPVTLAPVGDNHTIPFRWIADSLGNELNPHAAIVVPITLSGCPHTFYMQFDLGSPYSVFYGNKLRAIQSRYPIPPIEQHNGRNGLADVEFNIGSMSVAASSIPVNQYEQSGIDWTDTTAQIIIGTIGSDLIDNHILTINYPAKTLAITKKMPDTLKAIATEPFQWKERKILLPATLANESVNVFFDTGSSAFELLTNESKWNSLANKDKPFQQYTVNSWSNKLTAFTAPTDHTIIIASIAYPLQNVTRIEGTGIIQNVFMRLSGMGGMIGNKLFLNSVLVVDTQHQLFGLRRISPHDKHAVQAAVE